METVRVRVFVSVSPDGSWEASGGHMQTEDDSKRWAAYGTDDAGYWIEADLPLPNQIPEIVATVTRA